MKKILSVFLAVLMLAGCMAISFSASAEVEKIDITGVKEPAVGEKPIVSISSIGISDGYVIKSVTYYEEELNIDAWDPGFESFQAGRNYRVVIVFEPTINAYFNELPICTVNGKEATLKQYTGNVKYEATYVFGELKAPEAPQPENLCPWCGQVHEGFFHRILAAILGAKF